MSVSWPTVVILGVLAGLAALMLNAAREKRQFLARTPSLDTDADLAAFKRLAARDMRQALVVIAATAGAVGLLVAAFLLDWMSEWEAIGVLAAWGVVLTPLGVWGKQVEAAVKATPAADEKLRAERDRVIHVWMKKMFPNWD